MAYANRDGVRIHWRLEGAEGRPAIVLLNSIATTLRLYDDLIPLLRDDFLLLRVDTRGHGGSDAPEGDYSLGSTCSRRSRSDGCSGDRTRRSSAAFRWAA